MRNAWHLSLNEEETVRERKQQGMEREHIQEIREINCLPDAHGNGQDRGLQNLPFHIREVDIEACVPYLPQSLQQKLIE